MMEAIKVFRLAFSTLLFCAGLALLIHYSALYSETLNNVRSSYKDNEVYQQYYTNNSEVISHAELVATLFSKPEYDMVINNITIKKNTLDPESIKNYHLSDISYKKSYVYDNDGNITEIKYVGITN